MNKIGFLVVFLHMGFIIRPVLNLDFDSKPGY